MPRDRRQASISGGSISPVQAIAKPPKNEHDTRTQAQKFEDAARALGTDQDEDRFKDLLRTLAKPKI